MDWNDMFDFGEPQTVPGDGNTLVVVDANAFFASVLVMALAACGASQASPHVPEPPPQEITIFLEALPSEITASIRTACGDQPNSESWTDCAYQRSGEFLGNEHSQLAKRAAVLRALQQQLRAAGISRRNRLRAVFEIARHYDLIAQLPPEVPMAEGDAVLQDEPGSFPRNFVECIALASYLIVVRAARTAHLSADFVDFSTHRLQEAQEDRVAECVDFRRQSDPSFPRYQLGELAAP